MRRVCALFALSAGVAAASAQVAKNPEEAARLGQIQPAGPTGPSNAKSGGGSVEIKPIFNTWDEVMKRVEANKGRVRPPRPADPAPISEFLPPRMRYEDAQLIIQKRQRIADFEKQAQAAIAAGQQPPQFWRPYDPAVDEMDGRTPSILTKLAPGHGFTEHGAPNASALAGFPADIALPPGTEQDPAGDFDPRAPTGFQDWQSIEDTSRPSDAHCAVGATHVGVVVNSELAFYTKDGTIARGPVAFEDWWPDNPAGDDLFDPKIVYDHGENRFVMMAINGRRLAATYWAIAISSTSNPEDGWWVYYLRSDIDGSTDTGNWADYPGLACDGGDATSSGTTGGGIYITSNMYTAADSFQYAKCRVLRKYQLYNGSGTVNWWDFWSYNHDDGTNVFTSKPAHVISTGNAPQIYLVATKSGGWNKVTRHHITNPLASGPTFTGPTGINVLSYDVPPAGKQLGGGTTQLIDTNDCRTQDAVYNDGWVYFGCADLSDFGTPANVEAVAHYFRLDIIAPSVSWDGRFGSDDDYYTYPNFTSQPNYGTTMIFSRYGSAVYPQIRFTGREPADTSMQSSALLKAGEATYNPSGSTVERWGDYNGIGVDCAADGYGTFFFSQYARTASQWGTWVGASSYALPPETHILDGNNTGFISDTDRYYTWELNGADWSGFGMYQAVGGNYNLQADDSCPFGSPYQTASFGADVHDFIVANGTRYGSTFHHARVYHVSGPTGFRMEARTTSDDVAVGGTNNGSLINNPPTRVDRMNLHECSLTSGKVYAAVVDVLDGTCDVDLFMFQGTRFNGRRADNDGQSAANDSTGAAGDETILFTAAETSIHGFVVTNENFGTSNYTFKVWLKPLVAAIGDDQWCTRQAYQGPIPSLTEGSTPVTWSLTGGPAGMTINSSTGRVTWNNPVPGTHQITIRATNPAGFDNEVWRVTICGADFNCDGFVTGDDFDEFVTFFIAGTLEADYNGDGFVTGDDFDAFVIDFIAGC